MQLAACDPTVSASDPTKEEKLAATGDMGAGFVSLPLLLLASYAGQFSKTCKFSNLRFILVGQLTQMTITKTYQETQNCQGTAVLF